MAAAVPRAACGQSGRGGCFASLHHCQLLIISYKLPAGVANITKKNYLCGTKQQ